MLLGGNSLTLLSLFTFKLAQPQAVEMVFGANSLTLQGQKCHTITGATNASPNKLTLQRTSKISTPKYKDSPMIENDIN
jgi:hypothetical protein